MEKKVMTLCYVYDGTRILLGEIKKEGKLKGMFNGFGGKVEAGETVDEAARRELFEECGIVPLDMRERGVIFFEFEPGGNPFDGKPIVELHIFSVMQYAQEPIESDEMHPQWFDYADIPYDKMWPDDRYVLPLLFEGKDFTGTFFLKDPHTIMGHTLSEMKNHR
jgi:8-oxo-dGTP pyrophosphatase MutT (NUDIX family)